MASDFYDRMDHHAKRVMDDLHHRLKNGKLRTPAPGTNNENRLGSVDRGKIPPQPPGGFPRIKSVNESVQKIKMPW